MGGLFGNAEGQAGSDYQTPTRLSGYRTSLSTASIARVAAEERGRSGVGDGEIASAREERPLGFVDCGGRMACFEGWDIGSMNTAPPNRRSPRNLQSNLLSKRSSFGETTSKAWSARKRY